MDFHSCTEFVCFLCIVYFLDHNGTTQGLVNDVLMLAASMTAAPEGQTRSEIDAALKGPNQLLVHNHRCTKLRSSLHLLR